MRKKLLSVLAGLLTSSGLAWAEDPPSPKVLPTVNGGAAPSPSNAPVLGAPASTAVAGYFTECGERNRYQTWASAEYLLWRIKGAPVPVPLVTTNTSGNAPILVTVHGFSIDLPSNFDFA